MEMFEVSLLHHRSLINVEGDRNAVFVCDGGQLFYVCGDVGCTYFMQEGRVLRKDRRGQRERLSEFTLRPAGVVESGACRRRS